MPLMTSVPCTDAGGLGTSGPLPKRADGSGRAWLPQAWAEGASAPSMKVQSWFWTSAP